ncbi:uncharacterized protein E6C27_scaffold128G003180 [Cucumis melo var. makuwa]|uniref:Putative plant transposon protein domain-containing protein n=1 Tax=Cucumis melo var. makuwa TaxID=1194695 RepID=A0A5A7TI52_CUCMM|nr:uncharacterized protein E6C27_scaffold128G003180 [Cucumis melo var. makuwa]
MNLIAKSGLSKTISDVDPFYPQLIREFVVNFPTDFNDPSSPDYQTIHIRGFKFSITPVVINGFLGNAVSINFNPSSPSTNVLAFELSEGTLSSWPVNGIPAATLSVKYAILHKIGIANWFHYKRRGYSRRTNTSAKMQSTSGKDISTYKTASGRTSGEMRRDRLSRRREMRRHDGVGIF